MNIRAISIFVVGGGLILLASTAAITAHATGESLRSQIYAWETKPMTNEQRTLFIQARHCFETGSFESAARCLKRLKETRRTHVH